MTVTVRTRNDSQLVVRASAQFYLRAVEAPFPTNSSSVPWNKRPSGKPLG